MENVRRPVPDRPDQVRVQALLKEVFASQLKDKSVAGRRRLAQTLISEAAKSTDHPADQFVLLGGAIDAAREGKSLPLCF